MEGDPPRELDSDTDLAHEVDSQRVAWGGPGPVRIANLEEAKAHLTQWLHDKGHGRHIRFIRADGPIQGGDSHGDYYELEIDTLRGFFIVYEDGFVWDVEGILDGGS